MRVGGKSHQTTRRSLQPSISDMSDILLSVTDEIATLTINRPDKGNAITLDALSTLSAHLDDLATDPVRAVVLTGAGDRAFSAGMDLTDVADPSSWAENPLTLFCDRLERFPKPTIARINGAVIGGSVEIALACDLRIGHEAAKLRVPAIALGVHYEFEGLARAIKALGPQAARRIYMLGEKLDAATLMGMGFFDKCVAADRLDEAVKETLDAISAGAPLAVNGAKQTIAEILAGEDASAAKARIKQAWASDDMKEGLAAIREKRPPVFKGS